MELLARYLKRTGRHVYALVRGSDDAEATRRVEEVLESLEDEPHSHRGRWTAIAGDIETPELGISPARRRELASEVGDIVHSAASISFELPLDDSRKINVEGTRRVLEFAEECRDRGGLRRFAYISTAYVAGDHDGVFTERELDVGQEFRNPYERSKFEAEQLVRDHDHDLPVQVFRPSIIVGEQRTGWTTSFNVVYPPLKAFEAGAYLALPGSPETPVDIVPVDYVADAIFELVNQPLETTAAHHLVAGARATTVGGVAERAARYFRRRPPPLVPPRVYEHLLHPVLVRLTGNRARRVLERTRVLFPYFTMRVRFDDRRTRKRLAPAGIQPPRPESYLDKLLAFAVASRWGRRRMSRSEAERELAG
jgi:thioester reductase-like protein